MNRKSRSRLLVLAVGTAVVLLGCRREERNFRPSPAQANRAEGVTLTELQPGAHGPQQPLKSSYDGNALAQNQGQQLFSAMNCVGCHGHGGGNIGPPLLDEKWRYGSSPGQVFLTIMQGRPNGMPAFAGKLNEQQVWALVAYVRSLSGLTPKDAASARADHMKSNPPPNSVDPMKPVREDAPQPR